MYQTWVEVYLVKWSEGLFPGRANDLPPGVSDAMQRLLTGAKKYYLTEVVFRYLKNPNGLCRDLHCDRHWDEWEELATTHTEDLALIMRAMTLHKFGG